MYHSHREQQREFLAAVVIDFHPLTTLLDINETPNPNTTFSDSVTSKHPSPKAAVSKPPARKDRFVPSRSRDEPQTRRARNRQRGLCLEAVFCCFMCQIRRRFCVVDESEHASGVCRIAKHGTLALVLSRLPRCVARQTLSCPSIGDLCYYLQLEKDTSALLGL